MGAYVSFWVDNLKQISEDAIFVPLTDDQMKVLAVEMVKISKVPRVKK